MLGRDCLEDVLCCHQSIGDVQGICCFEIKLVLARSDFVVTGFNPDAHLLKRMHHLTAYCGSQIG